MGKFGFRLSQAKPILFSGLIIKNSVKNLRIVGTWVPSDERLWKLSEEFSEIDAVWVNSREIDYVEEGRSARVPFPPPAVICD